MKGKKKPIRKAVMIKKIWMEGFISEADEGFRIRYANGSHYWYYDLVWKYKPGELVILQKLNTKTCDTWRIVHPWEMKKEAS